MRRRLGFLRSLRWRLTLTYVAILAILLTLFGGYQYMSLRSTLIASRVRVLADDMTTARAILQRTVTFPAVRGRLLCEGTAGAAEVARTVALTVSQTSGHTVDVVVDGASLTPLAQVPEGAPLPQLDSAALGRALGGRASAAQILSGADGQEHLAVAFPLRAAVSSGQVCGVAQLSEPFAPVQAVLDDEAVVLAAGAAAALILALVAGLLLTSRALRPLRRLTATAQRLAGGDLRARSGVEGRGDEIGLLARTMDDMAGRIETSFAEQQESEARTRRFIADASHELRTPLTALSGYIDVIRRGATPTPESLEAALDAMARESSRMRTLVLDLLTLARLDAEPTLSPGPVDLGEALGRILDEGVPGMPSEVRRDLPPQVVASVDRAALDTVARNLLVNACAYAPGAPQVWRAWSTATSACFSVHDEGPGISPADLPHVFERFYRGEKTRAREEGGSGLGLSIVQGLVRAHGGSVSVASAPGSGTTFSVELPRFPGPSG
ncbi:MAG: sensor histidine kinase [Candidatus Dormibacteria bacterium]